jgi:hypothetical protein
VSGDPATFEQQVAARADAVGRIMDVAAVPRWTPSGPPGDTRRAMSPEDIERLVRWGYDCYIREKVNEEGRPRLHSPA